MAETVGALYIGLVIFGIVIGIAWIILPFALIGTKPLLRELIRETKKTNELLVARAQQSSREQVGRSTPPLSEATTPSSIPGVRASNSANEPKGTCPNCSAVIPLRSKTCPKCKASFEPGSAWSVQLLE